MPRAITEKIKSIVEQEQGYVVEVRHRLHRVPEPGFKEEKTSAIVIEELGKLELKVKTGAGQTGVIADLETGRSGGYVILRADMDALAIEESTGADYSSEHPGYSHCCGHDGHTATLLGTAKVLASMRDELSGRIRFIFQPAEEICQGARAMIEAGVLGPEEPDAIISLHCWGGLDTGSVLCKKGAMMASCDVMSIKIDGKGGHGARPHLSNNPLMGAAKIIEALSRLDDESRVVSLCMARVGRQANIIADSGTLSGTLRTLSPEIREQTMTEIDRSVKQACEGLGLNGQVRFEAKSPAVINDKQLYEIFRQVGSEMLGDDKVETMEESSMGSEDFGCYLEHVRGLLFRVGMGKDSAHIHESNFNFNDEALKTGMLMLSGMAVRICHGGNQA
ncbi:MAG: M20 metallopeptidase family protein [Planctomycetota bacterium]|jgi:amidohydrolase